MIDPTFDSVKQQDSISQRVLGQLREIFALGSVFSHGQNSTDRNVDSLIEEFSSGRKLTVKDFCDLISSSFPFEKTDFNGSAAKSVKILADFLARCSPGKVGEPPTFTVKQNIIRLGDDFRIGESIATIEPANRDLQSEYKGETGITRLLELVTEDKFTFRATEEKLRLIETLQEILAKQESSRILIHNKERFLEALDIIGDQYQASSQRAWEKREIAIAPPRYESTRRFNISQDELKAFYDQFTSNGRSELVSNLLAHVGSLPEFSLIKRNRINDILRDFIIMEIGSNPDPDAIARFQVVYERENEKGRKILTQALSQSPFYDLAERAEILGNVSGNNDWKSALQKAHRGDEILMVIELRAAAAHDESIRLDRHAERVQAINIVLE